MAPPAKTNAAEVHDSLSSRSAESEPNSPQHYGLVPDLPSESGQGGSPEIAVSNSRGSERRQKPVGKLREAALEEEGQQCSGNEEVIHLLALRCLIDEVRGLFGGKITGPNLTLPKSKQLEIFTKWERDLFRTIGEIHPAVVVPDNTAPLLDFLSSKRPSYYQQAAKKVHLANVQTVRTAAIALSCQQAKNWLDILTNDDSSVDGNTKISTLIQILEEKMSRGSAIKDIENEIRAQTSVIVRSYRDRPPMDTTFG